MQDETSKPQEQTPPETPQVIIPSPEPIKPQRKVSKPLIIGLSILVVGALGLASYFLLKPEKQQQATNTVETIKDEVAEKVEGLTLDPNKNYGDKYANGILPVGDNQYSTAATKGKVYLCNANFVPASQAGAQTRGPCFVGTTQWDINKKYAVQGSVNWKQQITNTINGDTRAIVTNDLPDHVTGTFPVGSSDPAA